jgi:hypothetical protein
VLRLSGRGVQTAGKVPPKTLRGPILDELAVVHPPSSQTI